MINIKYINSIRSKKRKKTNSFIYEKIARIIIDSLDLVKIKFENILEIGINEDTVYEYLDNKFNNSNFLRVDDNENKRSNHHKYNFLRQNLDEWRIKENTYDLIFSNCYSFISNNLENTLKNIKYSLKNDGFVILAIPENNSLYQLHNSMIKADLDLYNGVYQRVNPTYDINYILSKLKKFQFKGSIINNDKFTIEYNNFSKLLNDVRSMNLSYFHLDKKKYFEKKNYFDVVELNFKRDYFQNNIYPLEFSINIVSAWK